MTRFVVDPTAVIHLASNQIFVAGTHALLAPTLLRSQTLSLLHDAVHRGEIPADVGRHRLTLIGQMKIRYLGDAVLRRRAWDLAEKLGRPSTYEAEYLALTQLQGDALVTLDPELARLAENVVQLATIEELRWPAESLGIRAVSPHQREIANRTDRGRGRV
jgi:predicted nucleic acid-binding protein